MDDSHSDSDSEILVGILAYLRKKRRSKQRRFSIHRIIAERKNLGEYHLLIAELTSGFDLQHGFPISDMYGI